MSRNVNSSPILKDSVAGCSRDLRGEARFRVHVRENVIENSKHRAVKFYTEILGMTIAKLNRDDMAKGLSRADLRSGDSMVVLFQRPAPLDGDFIQREGATHQAFKVSRDDFELAKQNMKDWGVRIHTTAAVDRPSGSGFYFFDSEGNLLQLYAPPK